jgi:hypothetical protein
LIITLLRLGQTQLDQLAYPAGNARLANADSFDQLADRHCVSVKRDEKWDMPWLHR